MRTTVLLAAWVLSLGFFTTTANSAETKELKTEAPMTNAKLEKSCGVWSLP